MVEKPKIQLKEHRRILKYAVGADPSKDKPFEVIEREIVIEGEEAEQLLRMYGVDPEKVREHHRKSKADKGGNR